MYHFDYVSKSGGTVFECKCGKPIIINGRKLWSLDDFITNFIIQYKFCEPFTVTTTKERADKIKKRIAAIRKIEYNDIVTNEYHYSIIKQIDDDFGENNAFLWIFTPTIRNDELRWED